MRILLDTCAMLWIVEKGTIGAAAAATLQEAVLSGETIWVSPISAWEIGMLAARGRIALSSSPGAWFRRLLDQPGIGLWPLEPDALIEASYLPGNPPRDPADRIILATARGQQFRLVTRDRHMVAYGQAGHATVVAC